MNQQRHPTAGKRVEHAPHMRADRGRHHRINQPHHGTRARLGRVGRQRVPMRAGALHASRGVQLKQRHVLCAPPCVRGQVRSWSPRRSHTSRTRWARRTLSSASVGVSTASERNTSPNATRRPSAASAPPRSRKFGAHISVGRSAPSVVMCFTSDCAVSSACSMPPPPGRHNRANIQHPMTLARGWRGAGPAAPNGTVGEVLRRGATAHG